MNMKKHIGSGARRILIGIMAVLLMLPALSACRGEPDAEGGDETSPVTDQSGSQETTGESSIYDIPDQIGEQDFGGEVIRIASTNREWYADVVVVSRMTGDVIGDAVFKRNKRVEERLKVSITNIPMGSGAAPQYAVPDAIRNDRQANMSSFDIAWNPVYSTIMYTSEGLLTDLLTVPNLNLSAGYWSQLFNETASIGNAQYMAAGPISLSYYRYVFVTYVNKNLLNSHDDAPDLMEVVRDGDWTLDYQYELASQYYRDVDGIDHNEQDVYGFVSSAYLNVDPYWSSCEINILTKTSDNFYEYNLSKERLINAVDKILRLYYDCDGTYLYTPDFADESGNGEQNQIAEKFASQTALMATLRLLHVEDESVRNMTDKYMILPIAKLDASQTEYYAYQHDSFTGVAIPSTVSADKHAMLGAVLEVMASESYRTVTPAYYETALKERYMDDPDSWEMLDMITGNIKMDAGVLYTKVLDSVHQKLRTIINNDKQNLVASRYSEQVAEQIRGLLDEMQDKIKALQGNPAETAA